MVPSRLSILIPLFNEEEYVGELLRRALTAPLPEGLAREIIVVNDCSTDGSAEVVSDFIAAHPEARISLVHHERNQGKGAAVRTAIRLAQGEFSIIQDADLEYDPAEYPRLLGPLLRQGRRRLRLALPRRRRTPRPLLLALPRQPPPHHPLQHRRRPQPHRHGDLLQGLPHRPRPVHPHPEQPFRPRTRAHR